MKISIKGLWVAILAALLSIPGYGSVMAQMLEEEENIPAKITTDEATEAVEEMGGEIKKEEMEEGKTEEETPVGVEQPEL